LGPDRAFDAVVVEFDAPVFEEAAELRRSREAVSARLGEFGFARDARQLAFPAHLKLLDDRR
jgi:hypothetical protein